MCGAGMKEAKQEYHRCCPATPEGGKKQMGKWIVSCLSGMFYPYKWHFDSPLGIVYFPCLYNLQ